MNVGNVGQLKALVKPDTKTVNEALNLLSVLGGDKKAIALLNEMKSVQENNEVVLDQAKKAIDAYKKAKVEAENEQEKLKRNTLVAQTALDKREDNLKIREHNLNMSFESFTADSEIEREELARLKSELENKEKSLQARESAAAKFDLELKKRLTEAKALEENVAARGKALDEREAKLRSFLG